MHERAGALVVHKPPSLETPTPSSIWKPDNDPIYTQGGGDNFAIVMLMDGTLHKI